MLHEGRILCACEDIGRHNALDKAVGSVLLENGCPVKFRKIGVQDRFGQSGKPADLLEEYGLSEGQVYRQIKEMTE